MPPPAARINLRDLRRLPGRASILQRLFTSYRLWLAPDFLLQLKTLPYSQEVQRFAYRDIQALQVCGSPRWLIYNFILGAPLVLTGLLGIFERNESGRTALFIAAGSFLLLLIVNLARGPTCHCVLQTALGVQSLPSLSRRRSARRAVALIAERVETAQGNGSA